MAPHTSPIAASFTRKKSQQNHQIGPPVYPQYFVIKCFDNHILAFCEPNCKRRDDEMFQGLMQCWEDRE